MKNPHSHHPRPPARALLSLAAGLLLGVSTPAQEVNSLLDMLVEKKLLTPAESEKVRAGLAKENPKTDANKIKLAASVTELKLYGDLRLRYQYDQTDAQFGRNSVLGSNGASPTDALPGAAPNVTQRSRERFRLRLGADFKAGESFFGGFGLATGQTADSNFETYTSGFDNYNIYINKAFVGWKAADWLTVIAGKQENPFYTTDLVWDPDITPQGAVELVDISKKLFPNRPLSLSLAAGQLIFFDNDEARVLGGSNKDAWLFVQQLRGSYKFSDDVRAALAPGFNIYNDARASGLRNTRALTDLSFQNYAAPAQVQVVTTNTNQITVAYDAKGVPTRTTTPVNLQTVTTTTDPSTGNQRSVTANTKAQQKQVREVGSPITGLPQYGLAVNPRLANQTFVSSKADGKGKVVISNPQPRLSNRETADLALLLLPGDVSFKLFGQKTKLYWDFAYNLRGHERFDNVLGLNDPVVVLTQDANNPVNFTTRREFGQHYKWRDALAWEAGFVLGENVRKGDWSLVGNYRESGVASVDPNVNDSDFAQSALNTRGVKLQLGYNVADSVVVSASYSHAWNLRPDLVGGAASLIADLNDVDVFQLDFNIKF